MSALSMAIIVNNVGIANMLIQMNALCYYNQTNELKNLSPIFLACEIEDS